MKESAFILPAVIMLITLMMAAIIPLHDCLILALRANADESLASKAENQASNVAIQNSFNFVAADSTRIQRNCNLTSIKLNRVIIEKTLCSSYHSANSNILKRPKLDRVSVAGASNLPSLDFERFFANPVDCNFIGAQSVPAFPITLSKGSAVSSSFCRISSAEITTSRAVSANLQIVANNTLRSSTLAIKGFLHAASSLIITENTKIVAAGDVYIDRIIAKMPSEITLISASGDVKVNSLSGPITLKVFAAQKATIPSDAEYSTSGFEDYKLDFLPIGFLE